MRSGDKSAIAEDEAAYPAWGRCLLNLHEPKRSLGCKDGQGTLGVLTWNFTRVILALRANTQRGENNWHQKYVHLCVCEFRLLRWGVVWLQWAGSLWVPVGGSVLALDEACAGFFNAPASFHGDDCSFGACGKAEREKEMRAVLH